MRCSKRQVDVRRDARRRCRPAEDMVRSNLRLRKRSDEARHVHPVRRHDPVIEQARRAQCKNPVAHRGNVTAVFVLVLGEPLSGPVVERLEDSQAAGTMMVSKSGHTSKNVRSSIVVKPLDDCTLPRVVPTVSILHCPRPCRVS